ncbi:hypothetical protein DFH09DRAFT_1068959 [Mycena vulgaris]|nr:hypothetical protein DFH09DRAFT_1068959 [Mycena vulgaris]
MAAVIGQNPSGNLQNDPDNPNNARRRGPNLPYNCGGFWSTQSTWMPGTACTHCGQNWLSHQGVPWNSSITSFPAAQQALQPPVVPQSAGISQNVVNPPDLFTSNPFFWAPAFNPQASGRSSRPLTSLSPFTFSDQLPAPPFSLPSLSSLPAAPFSGLGSSSSLPSPLTVFTQTPRPIPPTFREAGNDPGTVQQQCTASIARMNTAAASSSPKHAAAAATTSGSSNRFTASSSTNSTPAIPGNSKTYQICILPFTINEAHPTLGVPKQPYRFHTTEQMPALLRALHAFNLTKTVQIKLSEGGNLWPLFDSFIQDHLKTYGIILPLPSPTYDFEHSPWQLLGARSSTKTLAKVRHPTEADTNIVLVAPTWGNLQGTLPDDPFGPLHPCFPFHVFFSTNLMPDLNVSSEIHECIEGCPDSLPEVPENLSESLARFDFFSGPKRELETPSAEDEPPSKRIRQMSITSIPDSDAEDLPVATYASITQWKPSPHVPVPPVTYLEVNDSEEEDSQEGSQDTGQVARCVDQLLQAAPVITCLQPSEILKWRTSISVAMGGAEEFLPLDISGPDVEAVATTLLDLVQVACCDGQHLDEFAPANNNVVLEVPVAVTGFFHTGRKFNIYSDPSDRDAGANGQGPKRSVYLKGLTNRLGNSKRWAQSSSMYHRPTFYGILDVEKPARMQAYKVDGAWAAIFMVNLGVGPDPICPFLILAATQPDRKWVAELDFAYIHVLDLSAASVLAPWLAITHKTVFSFPDDSGHPALALATTYVPTLATPIDHRTSKAFEKIG